MERHEELLAKQHDRIVSWTIGAVFAGGMLVGFVLGLMWE